MVGQRHSVSRRQCLPPFPANKGHREDGRRLDADIRPSGQSHWKRAVSKLKNNRRASDCTINAERRSKTTISIFSCFNARRAQTFDIATRGHRPDLLGLSVAKLYCVTLGNGDGFTQRPVRPPGPSLDHHVDVGLGQGSSVGQLAVPHGREEGRGRLGR